MWIPPAGRSRRRFVAVRLLRLRFVLRWGHGRSSLVFVVCWVDSGLCDGQMTRSGGSYWIYVCVFVCVCLSVCNVETTKMRPSGPALRCCATEKIIYSKTEYSVQWIRYRLDVLRMVIHFSAGVMYFPFFKASKLVLVPTRLPIQRAPVLLSPRAHLQGNAAYHSPSFNAEVEWQNCNLQFPIHLLGVLWNDFTFTGSDSLYDIRMHRWQNNNTDN